MKNLLLFLGILLLTTLSHGQGQKLVLPVQNIVIPVESILVQGVPAAMANSLPTSRKFSIRTTRNFHFVYRQGAQDFVHKLVETGLHIHLVSKFYDQAKLDEIAKAFVVPKAGGRNLNTLVKSSLALGDKSIALKDLKIKVDETLVLETDELSSNAKFKLPSGPTYFNHESFSDAQENRRRNASDANLLKNMPDTELKWRSERFKVYQLTTWIYDLRDANKDDLEIKIRNLNTTDLERIHTVGRDLLQDSFLPVTAQWALARDGKSITGCQRTEMRTGRYLGTEDISECAQLPANKIEYIFDDQRGRAIGCSMYFQGIQTPAQPSGEQCLRSLKNPIYAYSDLKKTACMLLTDKGFLVGAADLRQCGDRYSIWVAQAKRFYIFKAFAGMENLTPRELERRVVSPPPDEDNLMRLFEPWADQRPIGPDLRGCIVNRFQSFKANMNGSLSDQCKTDTLYSWGDIAKIQALEGQIGGHLTSWRPIRTLYATRGPISTFGYGDLSIRIRLRDNVQFRQHNAFLRCDLEGDKHKGIVYLRADGYFSDWTFCDPDVIHSWSYGTPEHYDEIVQELIGHDVALKQNSSVIGWVEVYSGLHHQKSSIFFDGTIDDRKNYSRRVLSQNMTTHLRWIENNSQGVVHFNPALNQTEKTREKHFSTQYPTHFNEE